MGGPRDPEARDSRGLWGPVFIGTLGGAVLAALALVMGYGIVIALVTYSLSGSLIVVVMVARAMICRRRRH